MHPPLVTSLSLTAILAGLVPATAPAQNGLDWLRLVGGPTDDFVGFPNGLDVAPNGDVWVAGSTSGTANGDVLVVHLDAAGNQLSSWTFGGSSFDRANAVRLDPGGRTVHVAGHTHSGDFPVTAGCLQPTHSGGADHFWAILDAATGAVLYATFFGGGGHDVLFDFELDPGGGAWLYGSTTSASFPTTPGAYQGVLRGIKDVTVSRLDHPAGTVIYSSYFGGSRNDPYGNCANLWVTASGVVTIVTDTDSTDLPVTADAWQPAFGGGAADAFVARLDTSRTGAAQLVYSSYAGGGGYDNGNGLWVDGDLLTVGGWTGSTDLPTTGNAPQPGKSTGASRDAFVLQLDISRPPAQQLRFGTYLGRNRDEGANDLCVDAAGTITLTGPTGGLFPTTAGSWQPNLVQTTGANDFHGFVARIDPAGGSVLYASFLGADVATDRTYPYVMRPDGLGGVVIAGPTTANLPVTLGPGLSGSRDGFVAKLSLLPDGALRVGHASWTGGNRPAFVGVNRMPVAGEPTFALLHSGAPGIAGAACTSAAFLLAGPAPATGPTTVLGIDVFVPRPYFHVALADPAAGFVPLPLVGVPTGSRAVFQFVYAYPSGATLHAGNALDLTVR